MAHRRPGDGPVRSALDAVAERTVRSVAEARRRGGAGGRVRLRQLEVTVVIAVQAGLAAALAALIAQNLLGPGAHVFAPAAAVGTIATAIGQRARRTFELLAGVGIGIMIGDGLRFLLGSGPWQTGAVVALAIASALLVAGRGGALVGQAGGTAVLIATLAPMERGLELPRVFDALVGGAVGLLVVALLLPINPLRVLDRAAAPLFAAVTEQLHAVADALSRRDADAAIRALDRLRGLDADIGRLNESLSGAEEVVTLAPARWHRRARFHRYARSAEHLERLILMSRALARWSATALQYGEPVPVCLPRAVRRLGDGVAELRRESRADQEPERTRQLVRESAHLAGRAWAEGVRSYGDALVTDLRTAASDLLRGTGCDPEDANRMVRQAALAGAAEIRPPLHREVRRPRRTRITGTRRRARLARRARPEGRAAASYPPAR
ncbi:fusaric acid resistance family protein [Micromonospora palomenae]|uniref:Fusaric acid resistance family protein n=1 Tax=Micromonospora palomenae TaxID=1461247 RepID=A0A561WUZ8_9ACTN|nr:fusaric acid resistance family protein [Micromonospora palomenae]